MKQAIKKKVFTKPSVSSIKEKLGLTATKDHMVVSSANKPIEFITMPEAFEEALKLPGIPMGEVTLLYGHSNTGKSALVNCLIASCQRQGILPIIFDTENHFSFKFAIDCGMQATPIYDNVEVEVIDEETGEITTETEKQIVNYDGDFVYMDSQILADRYGDNDYSAGKKVKTKRKVAVIEDIAYAINEILDMQDNGEIQQPICFIWDSVGSISSYRSHTSKVNNAMWDAGSLSVAFNTIMNNRIPSSKKVSNPYTNTMVCVNKVWLDSMSSPTVPAVALKGGKSFTYSSRLSIALGGVLKAATKRLQAESAGRKYDYGIITKVKVDKNQLDSPFNLTYEGTFCCVPDGIISESKLDEYKKTHVKQILKALNEQLDSNGKTGNVSENDIVFTEEESDN